jgi:hypothetical protein
LIFNGKAAQIKAALLLLKRNLLCAGYGHSFEQTLAFTPFFYEPYISNYYALRPGHKFSIASQSVQDRFIF